MQKYCNIMVIMDISNGITAEGENHVIKEQCDYLNEGFEIRFRSWKL